MADTDTGKTALAPDEFLEAARKAKARLRELGKALGPSYSGDGNVSLWHDQIFGVDINPSGKVDLPIPLVVGNANGGLFCALNVMPDAKADVVFSQGATVTFTFKMASQQEGPFEDVGPTVCMTAPEGGITRQPGDTVYKVFLPHFQKPWVAVGLEFSGTISGGNLICGLGLAAR